MTGEELRNLRESKGLLQVQLAEMVGQLQKDISRYETGVVKITKSKATIFKRILNGIDIQV